MGNKILISTATNPLKSKVVENKWSFLIFWYDNGLTKVDGQFSVNIYSNIKLKSYETDKIFFRDLPYGDNNHFHERL